jgi:hypothetical protein
MSVRRRKLLAAVALTLSAVSILIYSTIILSISSVHRSTAAISRSHTPSVKDEIPTAWCILDDGNSNPKSFHHFPHASQLLLPCWSYFCRARETNPNVHCGFWLNSTRLHISQGWVEGLVTAMNCSVVNSTVSQPNLTFHHRLQPLTERKQQWFQSKEDAKALRTLTVGPLTPNSSPQIGLVQRRSVKKHRDRSIRNLDVIQESILEAFPNATVEISAMNGLTFSEQAEWWSAKDVVVAAHGASMNNLISMRDGSSVIELYPRHYYPLGMYTSLSRSAGVSHYGYYNGVADPYEDYRQHRKTAADRTRYRNVDLEPPPQDVLKLVQLGVCKGLPGYCK